MSEQLRKEIQEIVDSQSKVCKQKFRRNDEISTAIFGEIKELRKDFSKLCESVTKTRIQNASLTAKVGLLLIGASALVSTVVSMIFRPIECRICRTNKRRQGAADLKLCYTH